MRTKDLTAAPFFVLCLLLAPSASATIADDCALADRYYALAKKAQAEFRRDDQYEFLEKAVSACESHSSYLALGEVTASFTDNAKSQRSAEAFGRAYELANTTKQEATAIFRYAELLHHTNNSQQALRYVFVARDLDPDNEEIGILANQIAVTAERVTSEQIVRGLGSYSLKPLQLRVDTDGTRPGSGGAGSGGLPPSVNIPLNFEFGTTRLTSASQANVKVLADTLADKFSNQNILFIGHADVRGTAERNLSLSIGRAQAVRAQVIGLHPTLGEYIAIAGKGEAELLSLGTQESDHRVNRRLEIKIR